VVAGTGGAGGTGTGNGGQGGNNVAVGLDGIAPGGGGGGKGTGGTHSGNGADGRVVVNVQSLAPLPVKFGTIKLSQQSSSILVEWTSYTETNVHHYEITRSSNGQSFTAIGQITARANNGGKYDYSWLDATPLSGVNFYRIKSVDIDGKIIYSPIVKINTRKSSVTNVNVYPNPIKNLQFAVQFTNFAKGNYSVQIINSIGQEVHQLQVNLSGDNVTQTVSLPASIKPGIYNLLVSGDNVKMNHSFVVQ
jgi:hypothetical protein